MKKSILALILTLQTANLAFAKDEPNSFYKKEALQIYPANKIDKLAYDCVLKKYGNLNDYSLQRQAEPSIDYIETGFQGVFDYYYSAKYEVIGMNDLPSGFYLIVESIGKANLNLPLYPYDFRITEAITSNGDQCELDQGNLDL